MVITLKRAEVQCKDPNEEIYSFHFSEHLDEQKRKEQRLLPDQAIAKALGSDWTFKAYWMMRVNDKVKTNFIKVARIGKHNLYLQNK